jgi:cytochrome subunit of sulfide dehydrogenase
MRRYFRTMLAAMAAASVAPALAQQPAAPPAPPAPAFAEANLSEAGVRSLATSCASCHGTQGKTVADSPVAALAGRPRDEIVQAMAPFKDGKRPATIMHQIAKGFSEAEIAALADYFSKQGR